MKVSDLFDKKQSTKIYSVIDDDNDNLLKWKIEPTDLEVIPDQEGHFIVVAKQTLIDKTVDCYIDLITPERTAENVIKLDQKGKVTAESIYDQENTVIPAVASDCMGIYELYYSKENPQIGIDILKTGLIKSDLKTVIAEDLGYIYRDENRVEEAIDSFLTSEKTNPTSEYIYQELAQLYGQLDNKAKEQEYQQKFKENGGVEFGL
jgi:tetratricopeptide (TPR) repeat protein